MRALMPAPGLSTLRKEMDRVFHRLWDDDGMDLPTMRDWAPSVDFSESNDAYIARVAIPGLDPKDVQVLLQNNVLTVKGEKKEETTQKDERFYRTERSYGAFSRSVRMPSTVDGARVTAVFHNGVLTVTVPKGPEAKAATIPIKME